MISLTNLTFGNTNIKSYLCTAPGIIAALVDLLESNSEQLHKAASHLLRNLAWKADKASKVCLSRGGVVSILVSTAMRISASHLQLTAKGRTVEPGGSEQTIKVVLSALWNLSAHCRRNKVEVCEEPGSLVFLVELLRSSSTTIVENSGGILRNISSHIAMADKAEVYRAVLREENCLALLLDHLRSSSLTIVSNSAGTLWNLSARSVRDQTSLIELGAIPILQTLTNSRHKSIATCAAAAMKNLQTNRLISSSTELYGGLGLLTERKARSLVESLQARRSQSVEDSEGEGEESYEEDSLLSEVNVTEVRLENSLPAHNNGNYLSRRLENINLLQQSELPLDLSKKRPVVSEALTDCVEVRGEGRTDKLDTRPDLLSEEKASRETKGEKDGGSLSSMDTDTTQSWCEEGSPVSTKSSKEDSESDLDNDTSESLLHDLISSAMPQSEKTEQDIPLPLPRPRSVWDCESSPDLTVINQADTESGEPDTSWRDNDGLMSYNVENSPLHLSGKTRLENTLNTTLEENINIINNNNNSPARPARPPSPSSPCARKEGTFVLAEKQSPSVSPSVSVTMRKSQSEHQLGRTTPDSKKENRRSWSKSPRTSRLIPGVVIKELKLKPRNTQSKKTVSPDKQEEVSSSPVELDQQPDHQPNHQSDHQPDQQVDHQPEQAVDAEQEADHINLVKVDVEEKKEVRAEMSVEVAALLKMTSSVISNYDDTISQIEEPSAMGNINESLSLSSHPLGDNRLNNILRDCDLSKASISQKLESICPPTLMNEITANSVTLVADKKPPPVPGATFTVEEESNTVDDVTDVFDEESTLTPREQEEDLCEVPELPLDSVNTTPTHSTSSKSTPVTVRKLKEENLVEQGKEEDTTSRLTYILDCGEDSETTGYRSLSTDPVDVDERLRELVADLNQWAEEDEKMTEIEAEARLMVSHLSHLSELRSRSASVVSGDESSRCSSMGILRESHITKLGLNSDLGPGRSDRPNTNINHRDSFANKEIRPKIAPKPSKINFIQNKFQSSERNKSYLIATNNPQLDPEAVKLCPTDRNLLLAGTKMKVEPAEKLKDKKSLRFSRLWKRTDENTASKSKPKSTNSTAGPVEPSNAAASRTLFSKTFRNLGMKKASPGETEPESPVRGTEKERLGSSIVLLSPNDTEMRGKLDTVGAARSHDKHKVRPVTFVSSRENLVPVIKNPRNKFIQAERALINPSKDKLSRKIEFRDAIATSKKKISASNKITLV